MPDRARSGQRLAVAVLSLIPWLALACRPGTVRATPAGAASLTEGPTRWLMLPEEIHVAERLRSTREAVEFVEDFWRRRDPDPDEPGNSFAKTFYERVEAADRLYADGSQRGSMTDRGRALILLGPPPVLRYNQKRVPAWEPGRPGSRPAIRSRPLILEIWAYPVQDLPPALTQRIAEREPETREIALSFAVEPRRTYLVEGHRYLEYAVQTGVRE
ncbi:MAG TPA: GWxTD domain-containing protein [Thermoanaerobaculia bacterium]|nr:GWxTD domain-containing protein [Thermoanaerobaculia bacterium]